MTAEVVAVVGPTAAGKSALAIALAQTFNGEIINADSMQLYQGMDIGTAKLPADEWGGIPHHLLDIWPVTRTASVADYQTRARAEIEAIKARGKLPILVGGSGLYITATIDAIEFPGTDPVVRARLESDLAEVGPVAMHARLSQVDPEVAASILPTNGRKIVRALEVREVTGDGFVATLRHDRPAYDALQLGLTMERPLLYDRVDRRVEIMWEAGLVDECRRLESLGLRQGVTASRALGYAQVLALLDGRLDEAAARSDTARATRRFARRQESWFRRDDRIQWLDAAADIEAQLAQAAEFVQ